MRCQALYIRAATYLDPSTKLVAPHVALMVASEPGPYRLLSPVTVGAAGACACAALGSPKVRDQRGPDEHPKGSWRSCYGTRKVNERCSAFVDLLDWLWVCISASARKSDYPSAYQLVLTALQRSISMSPLLISKTKRRTIDVLSGKRKTKSRIKRKCARPETKPTGRKAKGKRNPMTPQHHQFTRPHQ